MESNGLPGGIFSGMSSGMLGLDMHLQPPQHSQNPTSSHQINQPNMVAFGPHDVEHHSQPQQGVNHGYTYPGKSKQLAGSDEDEAAVNGDDGDGDGKKKMSPWHRMKWTDTMVRLLIMAVFYIGDEWGSDVNDPAGKKKSGGLLQKKGKWKSVSRAMMEKGHYVSPQQCEDKFNDLNKRYKRVNDILGKGTACKVVENQSLLDTMDLPPKLKEEAKKLLNSKHLFFREMCAYHKCCGHDVGGAEGANQSPGLVAEPSRVQQQQGQPHPCLHSSENAARGVHHPGRTETAGSNMAKAGSAEEEDTDNYADDDSDDEDNEDYEEAEGGYKGRNGHGHGQEDEDENERSSGKRPRTSGLSAGSPLLQQFNSEAMNVVQDGSKSTTEKRQWVQMQLLSLEEQQVRYQYQAFELEKQRLKWLKFSSKKEREMERARLENERKKLENERMVLLLRQKEMELL